MEFLSCGYKISMILLKKMNILLYFVNWHSVVPKIGQIMLQRKNKLLINKRFFSNLSRFHWRMYIVNNTYVLVVNHKTMKNWNKLDKQDYLYFLLAIFPSSYYLETLQCTSLVTWPICFKFSQWISKCLLGVIVWTKIPEKIFPGFLP